MAIKVVVKNNNVEKALSIFKRKVKDSNMMYELREREFFKKKSDFQHFFCRISNTNLFVGFPTLNKIK